jgi:hypothetical protein
MCKPNLKTEGFTNTQLNITSPKDIVILFIGVLLGIFGNLLVNSLFEILHSEYPHGIPSVILVFLFCAGLLVISWSISEVFLKKDYPIIPKILLAVFILGVLALIIYSILMIFSGLSMVTIQNPNVQNLSNNIPTINVNLLNDNQIPTIIALFISFFSIIIGAWALYSQQKHNKLSVRPIAEMERIDLPEGTPEMPPQLKITIFNSGIGPMIIKSVKTQNKISGEIKSHPFDWISSVKVCPKTQGVWRKIWDNTTIKEGSNVELFKLSWTVDDLKDPAVIKDIVSIRSILKDLIVHIRYTNIYGDEQPELVEPLEIFGNY